IQLIAFAGFVVWVRRRIGETAAWAAIPLLATYPGIYYWAGLPYCYVAIVPATLGATMIVYELQSADSYPRVAVLALLLGILFLPAMFLIALIVNRATGWRVPMGPAVRWVLLTALGLFFFINLAPPYKGWQFRGVGVSRIYQPVFAAMLVHVLAVTESIARRRP